MAARPRADILITIALLAGLPLLARRYLGPPGNRAAWWLRAACYAAFLALLPAKAFAELFAAGPPGGIDLHTYDRVTKSSPLPAAPPAVPTGAARSSSCSSPPATWPPSPR